LLITACFLEYTEKFGRLSKDSYAAILSTDPSEAILYITEFLGLKPALVILLAIMCALIFTRFCLRHSGAFFKPGTGLLYVIPLASIMLVSVQPFAFDMKQHLSDLPAALEEYQRQREMQREVAARVKNLELLAEQPGANDFTGNVIVVIGESITRNHMSIYGYNRPTTPYLDAIKERLIIFENAVSGFSSTFPALVLALTPKSYYSNMVFENFYKTYENNIIVLARKNGIRTRWISNQAEFGLFENPTTLLGKLANEATFISNKVGKISDAFRRVMGKGSRDISMVEILETHLESYPSKNLMFLHMQTAHSPYCAHAESKLVEEFNEEFPLGVGFFGDAKDHSDDVNCYDAALRLVDEFLAAVFAVADRTSTPSIVIYASDHGEAPALGTGHDHSVHSHFHNEIPLLIYANEAARATFEAKLSNADRNRVRPVFLSDLFDSMSDLLGIRTDFHDETHSVFNKQYVATRRILNGGNEVDYDHLVAADHKDLYERYRIAMAHLRSENHSLWKRVWAHRINSIGSLLEAKDLFAGIEIDIVFDGQSFQVYHPPKAPTGLTLEHLLEIAGEDSELGIWLDWKNPEPALLDSALDRLETLNEQFGLRRRAILETASHAVAADFRRISDKGWRHSYYLPSGSLSNCIDLGETGACQGKLQEISTTLSSLDPDLISFDFRLAAFVEAEERYFDQKGKITWNLSASPEILSNSEFQSELYGFEVTLVPFRSYFYY
jgi:heptose-I-phosphate ethanolaminephosphotransferase